MTGVSSRNLRDFESPEGEPLSRVRRSRTISLLAVAGAVALLGGILRISCAGRSCDEADGAESEVPFCSLEAGLRRDIVTGFRDGRSPDLLAVTGPQVVRGGTAFEDAELEPLWPGSSADDAARVPLVFYGTGVAAGGSIPEGTTLDAVAATLAHIAQVRRPHPEVRSGTTIDGVATGEEPRLILEIVWKGIGSRDLETTDNEWPFLQGLMSRGTGTLASDTGSQPLDPAAVLSTIGTGGLPNQHGITGTLVRNDEGRVVQAWSSKAPISVIATFPDDLDEMLGQRPMIAVSGTSHADRGVIGGNWYTSGDEDEVVINEGASVRTQTAAAVRLLGDGYGRDPTADVVAVVMEGDIDLLDRALGRIVRRAEEVSNSSVTILVTGTGSATSTTGSAVAAAEVAADIEDTVSAEGSVVEATTPGGVYLDQERLAEEAISEDVVLSAMRTMKIGMARNLFADAFPAIAVSFERYC